MEGEDLLERVKTRIGKPAATVVAVDDPQERYLIAEITFAGVALYVLGKYLDGFVEGLGIKKLGEEHAEFALLSLENAIELVASGTRDVTRKVRRFVRSLLSHKDDAVAKSRAQEAVVHQLTQQGLPEAEARQIAEGISEEVFWNG